MARANPARKHRKEKRTFSLSHGSVEFLGAVAKRAQISASEALDRLIAEKKAQSEKQEIAARIAGYYDSLNDEQSREDSLWGEFAESQLPQD